MFALRTHLISCQSQRKHLLWWPSQSPAPPDLSVHLPKQFAFLSSHDHTFASPGELRSTPMPIMVIAKKKLPCHDRTSEKGARSAIGRHGSVPAADFFGRKIPERENSFFWPNHHCRTGTATTKPLPKLRRKRAKAYRVKARMRPADPASSVRSGSLIRNDAPP